MRIRHASLLALLTACGGAASSSHATPSTPDTPAPVAAAETAGAPLEAEIVGMHGAFLGAMPVAVTSFGAASIDGNVYVAGGYFGEPHHYGREGQSRGFARFTAEHGWEELAPLDVGLQGLALVALDGGLVRCGGSRIDNLASEPIDMHSIASCARYSVADARWSPFVDLPSPRSSFDAAVLDGRIYAVGGWNLEGGPEHARFTSELLVLDPGATAWRSEPSPVSRRALAVVATTRAIVAIGGLGEDRAPSRAVDVYTPGRGWSRGPELPGDGFGVAATTIGDDVYASGQDGVLHRWRVGEDAWTRVATLALPRFFHRLVAQGDAILALGGIGSMTTDGRARAIEAIPLAEGASRIAWAEISFPGRARNRFGLFAHEDSLYVYGGNDSTEQHDFARANFVAEAFRLHLPSLRWFPLEPLAEPRQSLETVAVGDRAIALGGFGHDEDAPRTYADGFALEEGGHFRLVRDALPAPRTQFGTAVHDGAVWVFGGLSYDDALPEAERFTHLASVLRCPIGAGGELGACEEVGALPGTRRAFAGAALGDRYYVVGGMRDGFAPIEDCAVFDFATRESQAFACPSHVRISATMLALGDRLVLVGGSANGGNGLGPDRSVEVLDPTTGAWSTAIEALPFDTHQARWVVAHDRLVMIETQAAAARATIAWVDVSR
ncbi:MAG: hypothetical protein U0234_19150 [Sandaracinus sp.]